jgi:ATP-dependent exoDNAse (exonuclease V) beta subunit
LPDEALFPFRSRHGPLHPFRKIAKPLEGYDAEVAGALDALARLHKGRNHRPIALTIRQLLDETRAQAGFALWQAGDQILANVLRILQLARNFETTGGISFRGFVEHMERLAEEGEATEQPLIEEGVDGVRLMTVHRAKGLEFPVVILCDITCSLGDYASRHIDPDRRLFAVRLAGASPWELIDQEEIEGRREGAESQRLVYVAATRARDLLVVPAVADEARTHSWISALNPSLYPAGKTYRFPVIAPGCPRFGDDTVIDRPSNALVMPGEGIRPGQHKPRKGPHQVVWWDPSLLERTPVAKPGVRRYQILQPNEGPQENSGQEMHERWSARRKSILDKGSRASLKVITATQKAQTASAAGEDVAVELVERVKARPVGKAFGALVHELLASSEFDAGLDHLLSLSRSLGRTFGNTDAEVDAAAEAARRALEHPLLRHAAAAAENGLCYRETPFVYRDSEGILIEGVPDLAFREDPSAPWTVVDFKTDIRPDIGQDVYRQQIIIYLEALRQATGAEAKGVLLYV